MSSEQTLEDIVRDIRLARDKRESAAQRQRRRVSRSVHQDSLHASFGLAIPARTKSSISSSDVLREIHGDEFTRVIESYCDLAARK